jgi:hypothetical protein
MLSAEYVIGEKQAEFLRSFDFDFWLSTIEIVMKQRLFERDHQAEIEDNPLEPLHYVLGHAWPGGDLFRFPDADEIDFRYILRGLLEVIEPDQEVVLDYTDLVHSGYYSKGDNLRKLTFEEFQEDYLVTEKIIILSEGSSDKIILKKTLEILYPHLREYYSFPDFHASNAAGGAPELVRLIKAFTASGIRNRVVSLSNSATAAAEARRGLENTHLPENLRVVDLPPVEFAKHYPTVGPQGNVNVDINGLACSLELYLGLDVLKNAEGELTPIQWRGYNQVLRRYQGEILNKDRLRDKYLNIITRAIYSPQKVTDHDWEPMRRVFGRIFEAFDQ